MARRAAILKALDEIEDGMVIGFGTGRTMKQFMKELKKLIDEKNLKLRFIPSSLQSKILLLENGLEIVSLDHYPEPDLVLDSFDQADRDGNVVKGGGGAMLREKVLAQAARKVVYLGDHLKLRPRLRIEIPLEVLEYAYPHVERILRSWGMKARIREAERKAGPVISDNGNLIVDVDTGEEIIDPVELDSRLRSIAGVLETGIFPRLADKVLIGYPDGRVEEILAERRRSVEKRFGGF